MTDLMTNQPRRVVTAEAMVGSIERELGELTATVAHMAKTLDRMEDGHRTAVIDLHARLDKQEFTVTGRVAILERKVDSLLQSKALAMGALTVAAAVGGFVVWIFETIIARFMADSAP